MAWITPKTDWKIQPRDVYGRYNGDWFNVDPDYNRITGNIRYLATMLGVWFGVVTLADMPSQSESSLVYFDDINAIEQNLFALNNKLPAPLPFFQTKTWLANGVSPTTDDLNRIEGYCLQILETAEAQSLFVWRMPFNMGGRRL